MHPITATDLFAGPGGWDVAARELGIDVAGIEFDHAACETRRAAGLKTIEGDVTKYGPFHPAVINHSDGLIASPPCQTFSMAGNGAGRRALDDVLTGVKELAARQPLTVVHDDERTGLVLEPLRWALEAIDLGKPYRWIAMEQVPTVLPVWEAVDAVLEAEGYSSLYGYIHSEQYGVPQTRKRAILIARLDEQVKWPTPTHSRYYSRSPEKLDDGVLPWVAMAQALGWGMTERPSMTVTGGGSATGGAEPFGNAARQGILREQEAGRWLAVSTRPNNSVRGPSQPAPTLAFGHDAASFVFMPPGTAQGDVIAAKADGRATRITVDEAAILQTFSADHPWQGNLGKKFQQVGNAVPPMMAKAILSAVTS